MHIQFPETGMKYIQICDDGANEKVDGYSCFFTTMVFNSSGEFTKIGAWE